MLKHFIGTICLVVLCFSTSVSMADASVLKTGLRGYDAVAYQTSNKAIEGSPSYVYYHDGIAYLFASNSNLKTFRKDPDKYLPAYGGYCAMGVSYGQKLAVDPRAFAVVDGRLYLNFSPSVQRSWASNTKIHIEKANKNWPKIKDTKASKL